MADFNIAFAITTDDNHEGGFQKDPNDRGNWTGGKIGVGELRGTKWGISAAQFPTLDIENLKIGDAKKLYQDEYWHPLYSQIKDQYIGNKIFDMGVLFGVPSAVEHMQLVLRPNHPVLVDRQFGAITLLAINDTESVSLLASYKASLIAHALQIGATNHAQMQYVGGWIRRINS